MAKWLTLSTAGRYGSYSTVGSTFTYRLGTDAPVADFLRLRASWSRSVRAPNINDLFSNGSASVAPTNTDPGNGVTAATAGTVAANCRSIPSIAARILANGSFALVSSEANNTQLLGIGSRNLRQESAYTGTVGMVLTPIRSVSLSVDYYNLRIENGITRLTPRAYVANCYGATTFDAISVATGLGAGRTGRHTQLTWRPTTPLAITHGLWRGGQPQWHGPPCRRHR